MDQQDKIAHLNELAHEHFNEGNLSAAISAWQQVLEIDAGNADAQRGVALAQNKMGAAASSDENPLGGGPFDEAAPAAGGPLDSDATMMFTPGSSPPPEPVLSDDGDATMMFNPGDAAAAAAPPPAFDDDGGATMMFNPGDAAAAAAPPPAPDDDGGATMMFNPGDAAAAAAPAPPAPEPADADATMMFTPGALPTAPPPAAPVVDEPADADATMMFTPGALPPPPAPASEAPSIDFGLPVESAADQTMMTPEGSSSFDPGPVPPPPEAPADQTMLSPDGGDDFAPPPPPPPAPPAPPPVEPAADAGGLEDFEMPSGGLEMAGPPDPGLGGLSLPDAPPAVGGGAADTGGGGGFSFDLPPAAPGGHPGTPPAPGGDFAVPDLPALGLPPAPGAPPPLAPPPPPAALPDVGGAQPSGQFGEVDPGEVEGLAVPTVASPDDEGAPLTDEERKRHEEEKAAEFAQMYGDAPPVAAEAEPLTMAAPVSAIPWKLLIPLGLVIAIICAAVAGFLWVNKPEAKKVIEVPVKPDVVDIVQTAAEWEADYEAEVVSLREALESRNLDEAVTHAAKAREFAAKAGLAATPGLDGLSTTLTFEQGWNAKYQMALRSFCIEDYESAAPMFDELVSAKPGDRRPVEYLGRIYYNLGVQDLQSLKPWDSVWSFEEVLKRLPGDPETVELKALADSYPQGSRLEYAYTSRVDPLQFRKAGCN